MKNVTRVLFIHHSVGRGLLRHGRIRQRLPTTEASAIELWDHDYNRRGLTDGRGERTHRSFPIPDDNTDPPGLLKLFTTAEDDEALRNELSTYDVIVMKSCFPNSRIRSEEDREELKRVYTDTVAAARPLGAVLGVVTTPPVRPGRIPQDQALRAMRMAEWLTSESPFDVSFDLFSRLAVTDRSDPAAGTLRPEFTNKFLIDSHPTQRASAQLGEPLALFLKSAATIAQQRA